MISIAVALAAQAAAPASANGETQARLALAARGMSAPGIDTIFTVQHRHDRAIAAIVQRGRLAETAARDALVKRPVDVDGFAHAASAKNAAAAAFQNEALQVAVEQMRAVSPADKIVLATAMTTQAAASAGKR